MTPLLVDRRRARRFARSSARRFRHETLRTRLHVRLRLLSTPLHAVVAAACGAAADGRVVEVGTGHGLVAAGIAAHGGRDVLGVDIDADKLASARRAAASDPLLTRLRFELVDESWAPPGGLAAIVFSDVLYLRSPAAQALAVGQAARSVAPGGLVVVKETDDRPRWKAAWTARQEGVATRTITATAGGVWAPPRAREVERWLVEAGLATTTVRLDRLRPWPHYLVVGRRRDDPDRATPSSGGPDRGGH